MPAALQILRLPALPADGNLGSLPLAQVTEESTTVKIENNKNQNDDGKQNSTLASVTTHTRKIRIIHPPSDIRNIVDKTAQFVAKHGLEFEKWIIGKNAVNVKFNFLNASDPYHAYYQHRISEFCSQSEGAPQQPPTDGPDPAAGEKPPAVDGSDAVEKPDPSAQFRTVCKVLEPPETEQYTVRLPEGITREELDIIKLTAQFVARNGKSFLTGLTTREINSPQFHFLKPSHSMFMFFTALADAYSKVLMPPKGLTDKIRKAIVDRTTVLEQFLYRLEREKSQDQARQRAEDEIEQERVQMAMIDWQEFVVVEEIDFVDNEDEELSAPMTLAEVIRRSKLSAMEEDEFIEPGKEVDMEMDEEEVQLVQEGMSADSLEENEHKKNEIKTVVDDYEPPMRIVKNWKRPEERIPGERDPTEYAVSPITGELIPISEMSEHMRISLIDPKFKEQKDRMYAKIRGTTLASDDEISRNIVGLAGTRPDIFGTTAEEVSNAVKYEIEKKNDDRTKQVIWDGHTGSIGRTANLAIFPNFGGEDQQDMMDYDVRSFPGPAALPPIQPGLPSARSPPSLNDPALNISHPSYTLQYATATSGGLLVPPQPRPPVMVNSMVRLPPAPMPMVPGQHMMMNHPMPAPQHHSLNPTNIFVPLPPGSQLTPPAGMPKVPPPPIHQGMPPPQPQPVETTPPPFPQEPEPKRRKLDDSMLIPEDQFLAQHPGPAQITISVPNFNEGNLRGQVLEITVHSLLETLGGLKERISGEIQLPANKQKLSRKAGFLKENLSLAHYNVAAGENLTLSLRERGGRRR